MVVRFFFLIIKTHTRIKENWIEGRPLFVSFRVSFYSDTRTHLWIARDLPTGHNYHLLPFVFSSLFVYFFYFTVCFIIITTIVKTQQRVIWDEFVLHTFCMFIFACARPEGLQRIIKIHIFPSKSSVKQSDKKNRFFVV